MSDIFESVAVKYKNSPSAPVLFVVSFVMFVVGCVHFTEDVFSSYKGLISLEQHFQMQIQIFDITYWTMSISAQVASVVYFYIYLADTTKKWASWVAFFCQLIDFLADLWYRSNGAAFTKPDVTIASAAITLAFFTLGSEVFMTMGAGLCLKLAAPALHAWKYYRYQIEKVKKNFENGKVGGFQENSRESPEKIERPTTFNQKSTKSPQYDLEKLRRMGVQRGIQGNREHKDNEQ